MKRTVFSLLLVALPLFAAASSEELHLDEAHTDLSDVGSLQRGAKYFVSYCMGCHSANFMRFSRLGEDLGLTDKQIINNLMFAQEKVGETMKVSIDMENAEDWFGVAPPDLSVIARSRGTDWLYTYLRTFYVDESKPLGVNNLVFEDVSMPHAFWELQGLQRAVFRTETDEHGKEHQVFDHFELVRPGRLSEKEYDKVVRDLVNFLDYVGEPAKLERKRLGVWVLGFLAVFFVVAYLLKKEYWKDVH